MNIQTQIGDLYIPEDILGKIGCMLDARSAVAFSGVCQGTRQVEIPTFKFAKSIIDAEMFKFIEKFNPQSIHVEQLAVPDLNMPVPECLTADTVTIHKHLYRPNPGVARLISGAKSVVTFRHDGSGVFPNIGTVWTQSKLEWTYQSFPNADVVTICDREVTAEEISHFRGSILHLTKCKLPTSLVFNSKTLMITSPRNSGDITEVRFTRPDSTFVYIAERFKYFRTQHLLWVHGVIDQLIVGGETVGATTYSLSVTAEGARVLAANSVVIECPADLRFITGCYGQQNDLTGPVNPVEFREHERPASELARFCAATRATSTSAPASFSFIKSV